MMQRLADRLIVGIIQKIMTAYAPSLIANAFLYKARQSGAQLSHMQLQKLVFFTYAWGLVLQGVSHINERPQAWPYGPVFESLYHHLKGHGANHVTSYLEHLNANTGQFEAQIPAQTNEPLWGLLAQVWDRYGHFSALQLSALTHEAGGPWEVARQAKQVALDDAQIRAYYQGKLSHAAQ